MTRPKWPHIGNSNYDIHPQPIQIHSTDQCRPSGFQCGFRIKMLNFIADWHCQFCAVSRTGEWKYELLRARAAQAQVSPHCMLSGLTFLIFKKNTANVLFIYIQNRLLCLQLTFDLWTFDMVCHLALFKALCFGSLPHYVDLKKFVDSQHPQLVVRFI